MGAGLIIVESIQTLIDLPFFFVLAPLLSIVTWYRWGKMKEDYKKVPSHKWRGRIVTYLGWAIQDIPYALKLLCITLSIYFVLQMKNSIARKV